MNNYTRVETFSFLPPLSPTQAQAQAETLLEENYVPIIEFAENPQLGEVYWQQWPVMPPRSQTERVHPQEVNASLLMMQVESCMRRHPYAFIRLSGYCPKRRQLAMSFMVKTPAEGN